MPENFETNLLVNVLNRIDTKVDALDTRLDGMSTTLVKQQGSLEEHMRRTDLLEKKLELNSQDIKNSFPLSVREHLRQERIKLLFTTLKISGALAGTGVGGLLIKQFLTKVLHLWG